MPAHRRDGARGCERAAAGGEVGRPRTRGPRSSCLARARANHEWRASKGEALPRHQFASRDWVGTPRLRAAEHEGHGSGRLLELLEPVETASLQEREHRVGGGELEPAILTTATPTCRSSAAISTAVRSVTCMAFPPSAASLTGAVAAPDRSLPCAGRLDRHTRRSICKHRRRGEGGTDGETATTRSPRLPVRIPGICGSSMLDCAQTGH
jgi:hypothetical protein